MGLMSALLGLVFTGLVSARYADTDETVLNVGFILEGHNTAQETAFRNGIAAANKKLKELSSGQSQPIKLTHVFKRIKKGDIFASEISACELVSEGVVAIFGPESESAMKQALWVSRKFEIPYMVARWSSDQYLQNYSINLHPNYKLLGHALLHFLETKEEWKQLGIIYAQEESLLKYESLLSSFKGDVFLRKWDNSGLNHKYIIKYFRTTLSQFRFIVDIPHSDIKPFLDLINQYNMTNQYYSYVFTDWDTQFMDAKQFNIDGGGNFTVISLLPLLGLNYQTSQEENETPNHALFSQSDLDASTEMKSYSTESLTYYFLIFDTLHLLAIGLSHLATITPIEPPMGLTCDGSMKWRLGKNLTTAMKTIPNVKAAEFRGSTGSFEFDEQGYRENIKITFFEVNLDGFIEYGYWTEKEKLVVTKPFTTTQAEIQRELKGQTLRVITMEDKPFIMYKGNVSSTGVKSSNPSDWHGFCIDLLNACANALQFNYTVHLTSDNSYGSASIIDGVEIWDGVIGELQNRNFDLAIASLTINYDREKVIDFTTPFMNLGVSIIFKKPVNRAPDLFSFLRPLSPPVWGYVVIAYVLVSIILFFVARFSPYEWQNPHPCNAESNLLENNFNMLNSLWFSIGSLMQQGSDIIPRATSTRIIAGCWWFFTLIIMSSYTANLAAFLTVERMKAPIEDINDLAKQTKIKYGTREGGSSAAFFEKSNVSVYQRMWQFMTTNKGVMMNSTEEAIERVKRGGYAYILESTMNEYYVERDCNLMQVGNNLDSKGYGVGFPQGSKYRDAFSEVILQLQISQTLEELRRYWWRNYSITTPCNIQPAKKVDANSLGPDEVGGCFVMVIIGLGASLLISLVEFLYKVYQRFKITNRPFREEVAREFRFSMACSNTRDFGAESALNLPPPPLKCTLTSKDCRMAALAYAPCLPAATKNAGKTKICLATHNDRPSSVNFAHMHRRSSHRPSNSRKFSSIRKVSHEVSPKERVIGRETNLGGFTESVLPLLPIRSEIQKSVPDAINGWNQPVVLQAHNPIVKSQPQVPTSSSKITNPDLLENQFIDRHQEVKNKTPRQTSSGSNHPSSGWENYGDVRLKKYTC